MTEPRAEQKLQKIGLCGTCRHARVKQNARGSSFWRCSRSDSDPRFLRYPPQPVRSCAGHEAGEVG